MGRRKKRRHIDSSGKRWRKVKVRKRKGKRQLPTSPAKTPVTENHIPPCCQVASHLVPNRTTPPDLKSDNDTSCDISGVIQCNSWVPNMSGSARSSVASTSPPRLCRAQSFPQLPEQRLSRAQSSNSSSFPELPEFVGDPRT